MRTNIFWRLHKGAYEALNDRGTTGKIFVEEDDIMAMEIKENLPDYGVRKQNYSNLEQVNTEKEVQTKAVKKETENKSTYGSRREYSEYLSHKYACLTPTKDSSVTIKASYAPLCNPQNILVRKFNPFTSQIFTHMWRIIF